MNRSAESHFAINPANIDIPRSQFDMSHRLLFSGNVGKCLPLMMMEVLPGDTFKIDTSKVVRFQTMTKPIMDNLYLDTYFFFTPLRLVWDHAKQFFGESNKAWTPTVEYTIPQIEAPAGGFGVGSVADYLGIKPNVGGIKVSALPFRVYAKIMDEWFRSEALTDPLDIYTGDSDVVGNKVTDADMYCAKGGPLFTACKYHDMFTSCLPAPQSGPQVNIGSQLKVPITTVNPAGSILGLQSYPMAVEILGSAGRHNIETNTTNNQLYATNYTDPNFKGVAPVNLVADLSGYPAFDINSLRIGFAVQKFYERMARGGRRYTETIKSMFGVTSPDARLQRPEYLGGSRCSINVQEVTNNSESETTPLGNLGAMSHTNDIEHSCLYSATEHGYITCIAVVRYPHTYSGIPKHFLRKTMLDFYYPVFSSIGEQPIQQRELYVDDANKNLSNVFGYAEAWAQYRFQPDRVCGLMRPEVDKSLASWHLADDYDSQPYLSDSWIREDMNTVDRVLAINHSVSDQFFGDFYFKTIATRPMPMYSIPGLIDHH